MIDQRTAVDTTKVKTSNEPRALMDKNDTLGMNLSSRPDLRSIQMLSGLGSRGSVMLKAALSEHNKQQVCVTGKYQDVTCEKRHQSESQATLKMDQDFYKAKRSPRNKVLFSEPVVTQQYEYEQTLLEQSYLLNNDQNQQVGADCERMILARRNFSRRKFKPVDAYDCFDEIKIHGITPINAEDDEEDELYTMASSELDEVAVLKEVKGVAKKRPLNSIQDSDADCLSKEKLGSNQENHHETGGLFSSPKVAKIAPFCHNQTDLDGLQTKNPNANTTRSQRISLHRLALLSGSTKNSVPELLSVREIGFEPREQASSEATKIETPNSSSYFGWLSHGLDFLSRMKIF